MSHASSHYNQGMVGVWGFFHLEIRRQLTPRAKGVFSLGCTPQPRILTRGMAHTVRAISLCHRGVESTRFFY